MIFPGELYASSVWRNCSCREKVPEGCTHFLRGECCLSRRLNFCFSYIYIYHYHTVVFVNVKSHVLCEKFSRTGHFFLFNHRQPPFEQCCLSLVARVIMVGCSFFPCVVCAFQALLFNPFYSLICTCVLAHPPPSETSLWCGWVYLAEVLTSTESPYSFTAWLQKLQFTVKLESLRWKLGSASMG